MLVPLFVIGMCIGLHTLFTSVWNINSRRFLPLKAGPLILLYLLHSLEWLCLLFSTVNPALPLLNYVVLATASDTLFGMLLSRSSLTRCHALVLAIIGVFLCECVTVHPFHFRFRPNPAYIYCIVGRLSHVMACIVNKKALLKEGAFERMQSY